MSYAVKEMFYSLQGEGRHTGRPAVFCRFAGCNLWSGRERDRAKAPCNFCDTDFVGVNGIGGGRFNDASSLAIAIENMWGGGASERFVVLTGGEPLLQVGDAILSEFHDLRFEIALETNGTLAAPNTIDWITVSPKGATTLVQTAGNELKLVFPQAGLVS
ncbi:7-carboxy-7-deazaguanine synthase [Mesorhizobium temperatum]|uniref:7-carboxy-7-deazaguanine synthase n=1 Tax=Mesorhizobium temperatum TaxID=241416 RepID=A0A271LQ49_9HYPH|nr:7-carboxy-7-deazaguanine synthase [Mesorhizobium temperatum]